MKKKLLLSLALSVLFISGCGQNVEGIKADFSKKERTSAEQDFQGYVVMFEQPSADLSSDIRELEKNNKLPKSIYVDHKLEVTEIPNLDFKPEEYSDAKAVRDKLVEYIANLDSELELESKKVIEEYSAEIDPAKAKLAEVKVKSSEYEQMIEKELAEVNRLEQIIKDLSDKKREINSAFNIAYKEVVVNEKLPITIDKDYYVTKMFRHANFKKENPSERCKRGEFGPFIDTEKGDVYFGVTKTDLYIWDDVYHCIRVEKDSHHPLIISLIGKFGVAIKNNQAETWSESIKLDEAKKALKNAKIIAKNQTGIDEKKIEKEMASMQSKIDSLESKMKVKSSKESLIAKFSSTNGPIFKMRTEYELAANEYKKALKREAFSMVDTDVEEFNDEFATLDNEKNERGLILYVFTSDKDEQVVMVSPIEASMKDMTYGDAFSMARQVKSKVKVNSEDEALKFIADTM